MLYWINLTEIHVAGRNESLKRNGCLSLQWQPKLFSFESTCFSIALILCEYLKSASLRGTVVAIIIALHMWKKIPASGDYRRSILRESKTVLGMLAFLPTQSSHHFIDYATCKDRMTFSKLFTWPATHNVCWKVYSSHQSKIGYWSAQYYQSRQWLIVCVSK